MFLLVESNNTGGLSAVMCNRYVKSDKNKAIWWRDGKKIDLGQWWNHYLIEFLTLL